MCGVQDPLILYDCFQIKTEFTSNNKLYLQRYLDMMHIQLDTLNNGNGIMLKEILHIFITEVGSIKTEKETSWSLNFPFFICLSRMDF